jgi:hypothetical protein
MKQNKFTTALGAVFACASFYACAQQKQITTEKETTAIAFPGAEGFGKYTTGGRGGKVIIVTNLNDDVLLCLLYQEPFILKVNYLLKAI